MSDQSEAKVSAILAEAQNLLEEIKQFRLNAEAEYKAAEDFRKRADEHASYANQAKVNTEEHSKATALFKGTAESDQNAIAANMQKSVDSLSAITRAKADIDADTKAISDRRKEVEQASTLTKEAAEKGTNRLLEIEASKTSADTLLRETDAFRTKAAAAHAQAEQFLGQVSDLTKSLF